MSTLTGVLVVLGALVALAGSAGLLTLRSFYERVHPPTMGATLGTGLILLACAVHFSNVQHRIILHHLLIGIFMLVTTPVTYMMLVRAALHRDAATGKDHLATRRVVLAQAEAAPDAGPEDEVANH
jgi:multicomponent K+:H+ antiporter subunit G